MPPSRDAYDSRMQNVMPEMQESLSYNTRGGGRGRNMYDGDDYDNFASNDGFNANDIKKYYITDF